MAEKWDIEQVLKFSVEESFDTFNADLPIIYALSIGMSDDQKNTEELKYTYENHEDFTVFPIFGCTIPKSGHLIEKFLTIPGIPAFNPMMLLHGEQITECIKPLQIDTKYATTAKVVDIQDKVKGMVLTIEVCTSEVTEDNKRELACRQTFMWFVRKMGGFGFKGLGKIPDLPKTPKREHDELWQEKTTKNQALLYRLTGDRNPLHVDPNMSAMGGFDVPILHGMNFYAIAAKAVIKKFCNGDDSLLASIRARFTSHVFPGESIVYKMWKEADNTIVFEGITVERNTKCIKGFAKLKAQPKL